MPQTTQTNARDANGTPTADSNFYLKMSIKGVSVDTPVVLNLTIREWIFDVLCRAEIEIYDNGRFVDQFPFEDNDEIKIELNNIETREPIIDCTFLLQDHEILNAEPGKTDNLIIKMTALYKSSNILTPLYNRSFSNRNSAEVLRSLAAENGFRFESNLKPADTMTWIQSNQTNMDFIKHVTSRSYIKDDTTFCYVNRNNKMCYVSLKDKVLNTSKVKTIFFNMESTILNTGQTNNEAIENRLSEERQKIGSDNISFFMNWSYKNVSGTINKESSYGRGYNYYDLSKEIDSSYFKDDVLLTKHSNKEESKIGKKVADDDYGIIDTENTFEEYALAQTQNKFIKDDFFNSYLMIYTRPENDINLFDVVNVIIPSNLETNSSINEVHSGKYIVGGIIHNIARRSIYNSVLILYRNGRNIDGFLDEDEVRNSKTKRKLI